METDSYQIREDIKRYMNFSPCSECGGAKLNQASRSVKIGGRAIFEITALSVSRAVEFFQALRLEGKAAVIAERILREIVERLGSWSR